MRFGCEQNGLKRLGPAARPCEKRRALQDHERPGQCERSHQGNNDRCGRPRGSIKAEIRCDGESRDWLYAVSFRRCRSLPAGHSFPDEMRAQSLTIPRHRPSAIPSGGLGAALETLRKEMVINRLFT
jgi:hypothetical protein